MAEAGGVSAGTAGINELHENETETVVQISHDAPRLEQTSSSSSKHLESSFSSMAYSVQRKDSFWQTVVCKLAI